ncbi:TetR/AcrR family transcriptional regulator [Brachybacterium huguangmaarense]|uniref:TetR/AcrR family transcriptional regulator n=1 Tax=Brachybacterium huguangmaarense TaxID=1652028 RepID=A0ABY6G133_9MICO|nr:TetR/AcrR family transcriptional regulator [Brachybacterium huguangmaarense]UYG16904.1 TetR/AcrR family transcriptional regulator [Brachybacterium huguangmaarense]
MGTRDHTELAPSAAPGRRERAKADKRARILAAALALFEERGFERTSMSEVARLADVAQGTVFQYAATKAELLMMVAEALWGAHEQANTAPPRSAPAAGETAAQIAALVSPFVAAMRRWPEPTTWVAREILFGADMPHRQRVLGRVEGLEEQIAARLRDDRVGAPGAAAATGARLIVTGVLAELNRSRQGRIDGEDVDVVLRRLIDLVVAGAGASR